MTRLRRAGLLAPIIALAWLAWSVVVVQAQVLFGIDEIVSASLKRRFVESCPAAAIAMAEGVYVVNLSEYPKPFAAALGLVADPSTLLKGERFVRDQEGLSGLRLFSLPVRKRFAQRHPMLKTDKVNNGISDGGWRPPVVRNLDLNETDVSAAGELQAGQSVGNLDVGSLGGQSNRNAVLGGCLGIASDLLRRLVQSGGIDHQTQSGQGKRGGQIDKPPFGRRVVMVLLCFVGGLYLYDRGLEKFYDGWLFSGRASIGLGLGLIVGSVGLWLASRFRWSWGWWV